MTRETKIGLLVGLAFIIVIGILLSDHFTTATQPHQAALTTTIDDVLGSTRTLGPRRQNAAPLEAPNVEPHGPILVQPDPSLERREHVEVGAANRGNRVIDVTEQPVIPNMPEIAQIPDVRGNSAGTEENILAHTEPVVIVPQTQNGVGNANSNPPSAARENTKTYVAEAGDTLAKIATKTMGSSRKANQDAILKVNAKLAENPNKINIGDSLNIPVQAGAVASNKPEAKENGAKPTPSPTASSSVEYVVKDGDNLTKIAREQCGSGTPVMVTKLREMNEDVLKGKTDLKINMKLKLPPKQVASR